MIAAHTSSEVWLSTKAWPMATLLVSSSRRPAGLWTSLVSQSMDDCIRASPCCEPEGLRYLIEQAGGQSPHPQWARRMPDWHCTLKRGATKPMAHCGAAERQFRMDSACPAR